MIKKIVFRNSGDVCSIHTVLDDGTETELIKSQNYQGTRIEAQKLATQCKVPLETIDDKLEIFYQDLSPEMQQIVLVYYGIQEPRNMNFDCQPLFILEK